MSGRLKATKFVLEVFELFENGDKLHKREDGGQEKLSLTEEYINQKGGTV